MRLGSRETRTLTSQSPVVCPVDACVSFSKVEVSRTTTSEQKEVPAIRSKRNAWQESIIVLPKSEIMRESQTELDRS